MSLLDTLAEQGRIWTARHWQETVIPAIPSRYPKLDELLPGGGWPLGALTEILYPVHGVGELRVLLPALAQLTQEDDRWQLWLNPPLPPCGPALQHWGFNIERLMLANARNPADLCHSLEKSLQSGGCQAAVVWMKSLDKALMRRIQLAAEMAKVPVFLLRPERYKAQPSIAALRLCIGADLRLSILKRRAGWPVSDLDFTLPRHWTHT